MINVDINADLGEGLNIEKDIMPFLSSCSIACGGHSGNQVSMTDVVRTGHDTGDSVYYSPNSESYALCNRSIAFSSCKRGWAKLSRMNPSPPLPKE
jgi:hypothetical protein